MTSNYYLPRKIFYGINGNFMNIRKTNLINYTDLEIAHYIVRK